MTVLSIRQITGADNNAAKKSVAGSKSKPRAGGLRGSLGRTFKHPHHPLRHQLANCARTAMENPAVVNAPSVRVLVCVETSA